MLDAGAVVFDTEGHVVVLYQNGQANPRPAELRLLNCRGAEPLRFLDPKAVLLHCVLQRVVDELAEDVRDLVELAVVVDVVVTQGVRDGHDVDRGRGGPLSRAKTYRGCESRVRAC